MLFIPELIIVGIGLLFASKKIYDHSQIDSPSGHFAKKIVDGVKSVGDSFKKAPLGLQVAALVVGFWLCPSVSTMALVTLAAGTGMYFYDKHAKETHGPTVGEIVTKATDVVAKEAPDLVKEGKQFAHEVGLDTLAKQGAKVTKNVARKVKNGIPSEQAVISGIDYVQEQLPNTNLKGVKAAMNDVINGLKNAFTSR